MEMSREKNVEFKMKIGRFGMKITLLANSFRFKVRFLFGTIVTIALAQD